jgi:hypothetical protein
VELTVGPIIIKLASRPLPGVKITLFNKQYPRYPMGAHRILSGYHGKKITAIFTET